MDIKSIFIHNLNIVIITENLTEFLLKINILRENKNITDVDSKRKDYIEIFIFS